jgi:hypothetical protein
MSHLQGMHSLLLLKIRLDGLHQGAVQRADTGFAQEVETMLFDLQKFFHYASGAVALLAECEVVDELHPLDWQAKRDAILNEMTNEFAEVLGEHKLAFDIKRNTH